MIFLSKMNFVSQRLCVCVSGIWKGIQKCGYIKDPLTFFDKTLVADERDVCGELDSRMLFSLLANMMEQKEQ